MKRLFFFSIAIAITFTSFKCNEVKTTVKIGTQTWCLRNLDVSTFRNGDSIPEAKTCEEWNAAAHGGKPAWCYYDNDLANAWKYGKLYNWYAVHDSRGLAPAGQHISSFEEWVTLITFLGGDRAGAKLKAIGWWPANDIATNESGFEGLPGGVRLAHITLGDPPCKFESLGFNGYFWNTREYTAVGAGSNRLGATQTFVTRQISIGGNGMSVRCLLDDIRPEGNPNTN